MATEISPAAIQLSGNVVILCSTYNAKVTDALLNGALLVLQNAEIAESNIVVLRIPGAFELSTAAMQAAKRADTELVIALGAVIRGETPHFDYICQAVAFGITRAAQETGKPVTFGVITADTPAQAFEREGGAAGNKGSEAAQAALDLYSVLTQWEKRI
jgi:6,7-dimethyl-8-ribityllumazine synthase